MWSQFEYEGCLWVRRILGDFEAQLQIEGGARQFRIVEIPTAVVLYFGTTTVSVERAKLGLSGLLSTMLARRTSEVAFQIK